MCLQCMAESKTLVEDIVPGFDLQISSRDPYGISEMELGWPEGWYGLVKCNDPLVVWKTKPVRNLCYNYTEKQLEKLSDDHPVWDSFSRVIKIKTEIDKNIQHIISTKSCFPWKEIYQLINACNQAGWDPEDSACPILWLIDHIARKLEKIEGEYGDT